MASRFPTTLSLLSFLIVLLDTNLFAYSQNIVLDINGDFLQPGIEYFIVPNGGGSIRLSSAPNRTCPLDVVFQNITDVALPVKFSPVNSKDNFFNEGTDVNIEFSAFTICVTSTVWRIKPSRINQTTQYFVTTGGVKGNPGRGTLSNWFNIENSELGGYVINFCPAVCETCRPVCGNIGLILENGRTRLGITSDASGTLLVSFAPSPTQAS